MADGSEISEETRAAIHALLSPRSIAIAGASADPSKIGSLPLAFLQKHGYAGRILPIHPKEAEIRGVRCYRSITEIDGDVDLLVVAIAASRIVELFDECRPGQVKAALIFSSGFAEIGADGAALQRAVSAAAAAKGIRYVGPNSVGVANLHEHVMPSISQVFDQTGLVAGPIGFVSQSGAVGTAITALAHAEQIGIGYFLSTGNEGDLEFGDFCHYFADDPAVRIIAGYVESIRDGAKFRAAALKAARAGKPIALIKVGTSDAGGKAVQSHTGALAGAEEVYRTAFAELGVIRVDSIEALTDVLKVTATFPDVHPERGRRPRVAVLSHSGGAGVLMADACIAEGLDVAPPSAALVGKLKARLPSYASFQNPVDMTANVVFDAALMANTMRDVVESGEYDAVLLCVNLIWRQGPALAEQLATLASSTRALVAVAWIAGKPEPVAALNASGVPVFADPVRCVRAVARRLHWEARSDLRVEASSRTADSAATAATASHDGHVASRRDLGVFGAQQALLADYGIATAPCALVRDAAEARAAAARLGYPVAAKIVARGLAHKSEIGGVALDIDADARLDAAVARLSAIDVPGREGVLVQRMVSGPIEIFAGMKRDPVFGPVIVVGLGGIYVEILRETVMKLAPFDAGAARALLEGAKFHPLLAGARGKATLDIDGLARIVAGLSQLAVDEPAIESIDLNPIILREGSAVVVDFKFALGDSGARDGDRREASASAA
jgi:acyl-CoA synthetase (NDP forming)